MKEHTIYILHSIQIFQSKTPLGNGYVYYRYHGERELEPHIALTHGSAIRMRAELKKEYEQRGLRVSVHIETFRTRKRTFVEAIERYRTEVGA